MPGRKNKSKPDKTIEELRRRIDDPAYMQAAIEGLAEKLAKEVTKNESKRSITRYRNVRPVT